MGSKMIVVKSKGYVDTSRGPRVYAPISRPYREKTEVILRMITVSKADVYEVLPDKTEVKLDVTNYDKDNHIVVNNIKCETPKVASAADNLKEVTPTENTSTINSVEVATKQFDPLIPDYGASLAQTPKFMESMSVDSEESSEHEATAQTPDPIVQGDTPEEVSDSYTVTFEAESHEMTQTNEPSNESWKQSKRNKKHNMH